MVEINEAERKKEKRIKRNEDNLRDLWDNVKCPNIRIIGVPEEEDKKKEFHLSVSIIYSDAKNTSFLGHLLLIDEAATRVDPAAWDGLSPAFDRLYMK